MGCACRGKTRPFGPSSIEDRAAAQAASRPETSNNPAKARQETYVLRTPEGTFEFGSRLEAEAERRRAGGGSIVRRN